MRCASSHLRQNPIDPRLARMLWQWLALGLLLSAALPAARGYSVAIGWLWYWLIAAPLLAQCVLHRQHLWLALRDGLRRNSTPRTNVRKAMGGQARRSLAVTRKPLWLRVA